MALLFVCRQGHQWQTEQPPDRAAAEVRCPYCGSAGQAQETLAGARTLDADGGTLPPAATPPLVDRLPTLRSPGAAPPAAAVAPERIGNYQVVGELGRGGMGVVYKARQQGLDRFVAIKMILAGKYSGGQSIGRFRQEAEAVARLQHANIVQIYEIGEHDGRPFLALEYVAGSSLGRTLSGTPQPPAVAARLIQTLSRAIAHAHRRGIIHRDLTPANILLAADEAPGDGGRGSVPGDLVSGMIPKITDFGLAKRLDDEAGQTVDGTVMGTPNYMSPEQASGRIDAIGPKTDVYALGAVLYELLTGRPPFVGETAMATVAQVIHREPVPPSYLQPRIPRDLETICLKCLEKDPSKRYASADDLADDLGRFLEERPILARRTSIIGRGWKWSKRRPAVAALIAVAVLSAIGFVVGSQWYSAKLRKQRDAAESDYRQTMQTMEKVLADIDLEQLVYDPGQEQQRRPQVEAALGLYEQFLKHWAHDARLRKDTANAYRKLGDIELWLGDHAQARAAYANAVKTYDLLRREDQDRPEYRRCQAYCWNFLGETHRRMSQSQDAESAYQQAIKLQQPLAKEPSAMADDLRELARAYYNLGILYRETNRGNDAEKLLGQATELLENLAEKRPGQPDYLHHLARAHINLGPILRATNRVPAAIDAYGRAIELLGTLAREHQQQPEYRYELAVAHVNRGNAFRADNQLPKAKEDYDLAQQTLAALVADHPHVPVFLQELANCENSLAAVLVKTDGLAAAEKEWLDACQRLRQLDAQPNAPPAYRGDMGMTLGNLGWVYLRVGNAEKSRRYLKEGIDYLEKALQANPDHPDYQLSLRGQYRDLAESSLQLGDHAAAAAAATQLAKIAGGSAGDQFQAVCLLIRAGAAADADTALSADERRQQSERSFGQARALIRQLSQGGYADVKGIEQASSSLAAALEKNAELKEALADLQSKARQKAAPPGE